MNSPVSILFVCMGNICRSPAAEAIFKEKVNAAGLSDKVTCDSAGTIGYHEGSPADRRMRAAGAQRGYSLDSISRQIRPEDFERFDHIIAMDRDNLEGLRSIGRGIDGRAKISMMCDYARHHDDREVPDPYYGGEQGFTHVMELLEDACVGLLEDLSQAKA